MQKIDCSAQKYVGSAQNNICSAQKYVWGTDKPNSKITITASWGKTAVAATDKAGNWKTTIQTTDAGGPFLLTVHGTAIVLLKDVLLGEVWLCSGQSNMEMPVKGFAGMPVFGSQEAIMNSRNSKIRLFNAERNASVLPINTCTGKWLLAEPRTVCDFSAKAYFFGLKLYEQLGVPIGLITSSWGGTPAEAWMPKTTLSAEFPEFEKGISNTADYSSKTPTALFNGMINPLIPFTVKGAIWYQGEANKDRSEQYARLFPAMVKSWRDLGQQGNFPFYFVQVAPLQWGNGAWPKIREAQLKSWQAMPNSGMVVTMDIGTPTCIHPPKKREVGERLALWALAKDYGMDYLQYSEPGYKSMEVKAGKMYLNFDFAPHGVTNMYKGLSGFEICGADGEYKEAKAVIEIGQLIVWHNDIKEPKGVRYGWQDYFDGCLFNTDGLPASSFRSDMGK